MSAKHPAAPAKALPVTQAHPAAVPAAKKAVAAPSSNPAAKAVALVKTPARHTAKASAPRCTH